ncbi:glycerol dehydratase reactivase beta/small subunit family protein [Actinomycetospora lutea]|uniref:glycerol dehydratase reactivase beta/small subunit family protein n=1 Tax=Actinomycetospora lutea TaxID=663604 RepID=UPI0023658D6D|nr:glycerol dehydratase reactivase beta/small subunit family protein [Actinomycetospora lutea]MDD7938840.1 glycerol dehydratase reactivase beta/small subunit family protein [Actinomycetospora lutea]
MTSPLSGVSASGGPGCHGRIDRPPRDRDLADPALPPAVLVAVHDDAPPGVVRELCAGAEEQGVPTALLGATATGADAAGRHAASESRLEVGVGVGVDGAVVVRHALVPDAVLALDAGAATHDLRVLGGDAARIVAGLPLRMVLGQAE